MNSLIFLLYFLTFGSSPELINKNPLHEVLSPQDTCVKIFISSATTVFSNKYSSIPLAIKICNNTNEVMYMPEALLCSYYAKEGNGIYKNSTQVIIHMQRKRAGEYEDYQYPPGGIILDNFDFNDADSSENALSKEGVLQNGDCMKYNKFILLFDTMPEGIYRIRVMYNYPFSSDCESGRSNWFNFEIDNSNSKH